MTHRIALIAAGILICSIAPVAWGQSFSLDAAPPGGVLPSISQSVRPSGKVRVIMTASNASAPAYAHLRASATTVQAEQVIMNINTPQLVFFRITGPTDTTNLTSIESIDFVINGNAVGELIVTQVRTSGEVGTIRAHGLDEANIGSNVTTKLETVSRGLSTVNIGGSLLGDVFVDAGYITTLNVTSAVGGASPIIIRSRDGIGTLSAASINASIYGANSTTPTGTISLLTATTGGFAGSLLATSLTGGIGTTGLRVTGGLNADVNFTQNAAPVSGRFMRARSVLCPGE